MIIEIQKPPRQKDFKMKSEKAKHEIEFGKVLAQSAPEEIWGWGTPAGKLRAIRRAKLIIKHAEIDHTTSVLEIGCGNGNFTREFAKSGAEIIALDISPELINLAKANSTYDENQVQFICAQFEDHPFPELLDAIIGSSVLHHLEISNSLKKIFSLIKPGGKVVFAEPNMLNPQVFLERTILRNFLSYVTPDETAFIKNKIEKQLGELGFTNIVVFAFDWLHPATPTSMLSAVGALGKVFENTPGVREFAGSLLIAAQKPE